MTRNIILLVAAMAMAFNACGWLWNDPPDEPPFPPCYTPTIDGEGIVQSFTDNCIKDQFETGLVIRDSASYNALLEVDTFDYCAPLPSINFDSLSVLLLTKGAGGCQVGFIRNVYRNDVAKTVTYVVEANGCGYCDMYGQSHNFVSVARIPADYTVIFQ